MNIDKITTDNVLPTIDSFLEKVEHQQAILWWPEIEKKEETSAVRGNLLSVISHDYKNLSLYIPLNRIDCILKKIFAKIDSFDKTARIWKAHSELLKLETTFTFDESHNLFKFGNDNKLIFVRDPKVKEIFNKYFGEIKQEKILNFILELPATLRFNKQKNQELSLEIPLSNPSMMNTNLDQGIFPEKIPQNNVNNSNILSGQLNFSRNSQESNQTSNILNSNLQYRPLPVKNFNSQRHSLPLSNPNSQQDRPILPNVLEITSGNNTNQQIITSTIRNNNSPQEVSKPKPPQESSKRSNNGKDSENNKKLKSVTNSPSDSNNTNGNPQVSWYNKGKLLEKIPSKVPHLQIKFSHSKVTTATKFHFSSVKSVSTQLVKHSTFENVHTIVLTNPLPIGEYKIIGKDNETLHFSYTFKTE